ncbi:MAG: DNA methyltransferase [Treponema sp.]|nr:DNA methyltransferase [Spirochaetales bacterium]MDY5811182.1 DNA methyltransferase [Treponema sp.]
MEEKVRAQRNQTLTLHPEEVEGLKKLITPAAELNNDSPAENKVENKIFNGDIIETLKKLPDAFADLIIIDPPYNLTKNFNGNTFNSMKDADYESYVDTWLPLVCKKLKANGSLYLCGDWKSTSALQRSLEKNLTIINRITWQREKGRGAKSNWKNGMEDIWFAVKNPNDYYFNIEAVKQKRKVIAPYKQDGKPKDWQETEDGNFRLTYPSNFWDDISIPFWSMPENTDHPTQKPEKLCAKLILASCPKDGLVFDPFLGSGTSAVTAKKLGRKYCGIELNEEYCLYTAKRLLMADKDNGIQGYIDGVFWERNSAPAKK